MSITSPCKTLKRMCFVVCLGLLCCGCMTTTSTPTILLPAPQQDLDTLLSTHALPPGQNIKAVALGKTVAMSYHLVQIRDREQPHLHATHDLVVTVLRSTGTLFLSGKEHPMSPGDSAVIPSGAPHYFVNTGDTPAAALVTFAPPYDGPDSVAVELP